MALALTGAAFDEYAHLGYSTWLSACRAAGPSLGSLVRFTLELLPGAVIGMLAGGLLVLVSGVRHRKGGCAARTSLAAHGGCAAGMAGGLLLCMLPVPVPLMLIAEAALAAAAAVWLFRRGGVPSTDASVNPPTRLLTSAQ